MYAKGRRFEYRVRDLLEESGYYVIRSAGSKGIVDLAAFKITVVLFIQCKNNSNALSHEEWNKLFLKSRELGTTPIHAFNVKGKIQLERLLSRRALYEKGVSSTFTISEPSLQVLK